jgi:hypothetical protein
MYPPVFEIATQSAAVLAELGSNPTRLWPFDRAPQKGQTGYGIPYAVHQLVYGTPVNTLSCIPLADNFGIQFDAYAKTATDAREVAAALRDAYEASHNPVVAWNGETWEQATGLYRVSFTVEFWPDREAS